MTPAGNGLLPTNSQNGHALRKLSVLVVGDIEHPDFYDCLAELRADGASVVTELAELPARLSRVNFAAPVCCEPDLIIVAQAAPGSVPASLIKHLRRIAPLASIVALLGSWCEGEMRSGKPWPGVARVYWHQWLVRYRRERNALAAGKLSGWTLPPSAGDDERLLLQRRETNGTARNTAGDSRPNQQPLRSVIAIAARDLETLDAVTGVCQEAGFGTVWWQPGKSSQLASLAGAILCGTHLSDHEVQQVQHLRQLLDVQVDRESMSPSPGGAAPTFSLAKLTPVHFRPIIALLDFPRREDVARAHSAGASAVVSKPFLVEELIAALQGYSAAK